jgi:hypothetical protein
MVQGNLSIFWRDKWGLCCYEEGEKKDSSIYIYSYWRFGLNLKRLVSMVQLNQNDGSNAISQKSDYSFKSVDSRTYGSVRKYETLRTPLELVYVDLF